MELRLVFRGVAVEAVELVAVRMVILDLQKLATERLSTAFPQWMPWAVIWAARAAPRRALMLAKC